MYIDDSSGLTPTEVRSRARRIFREHGVEPDHDRLPAINAGAVLVG